MQVVGQRDLFEFDEECLKAFRALKEILTSTPII
jgi:hypothetical protein